MPITVVFSAGNAKPMTVVIYSNDEAVAEKKANQALNILDLRCWAELTGIGSMLTKDDMKAAINSLVKQGNPDGRVRVHCESGLHRSVVAAILYLWSQPETVDLERVYTSVEAAYKAAGYKEMHPLVKKTLCNSLGPLFSKDGARAKRSSLRGRSGDDDVWEKIKGKEYSTIKMDLCGV